MSTPKVPSKPEPNPLGFEVLTNRLYLYVEGLTSKQRKTQGIIWLAIAAVFMVASSLPLPPAINWIVPIIGVPGGVILFVLGLAVVHVTSLKNWRIFSLKDWAVPRKRATYVGIGAIISIAALIVLSRFIPTGIGGSLIVLIALTGFNALRRTPYEADLAARGIPDPRETEIEVEYYEEYEETDEEEPLTPDNDDSSGQRIN